MKTALTFAPILLVLALPLALPEPMHQNMNLWVSHRHPSPWSTSANFAIIEANSDPAFAIFTGSKVSINVPRARRYIDRYCAEELAGPDCLVARTIVAMAEHDYEVLP